MRYSLKVPTTAHTSVDLAVPACEYPEGEGEWLERVGWEPQKLGRRSLYNYKAPELTVKLNHQGFCSRCAFPQVHLGGERVAFKVLES